MTDPAAPPLDVVLYGATGFVGRLVADYLAREAGASVRIGLAGRSRDRLTDVRDGLGPAAADWDILVADATDEPALRRLAGATRVLASTVGPYHPQGLPLVRACAEAGTHYADLTGEVLFMRQSAEELHGPAQASGARIVHACGFDSVPSDLSVLLTAERARADHEGELRHATLTLRSASGGISGGTIGSLRTQLEAAQDPDNRRIIADPYALSPGPHEADDADADPTVPFREVMTGRWVAPFPMGPANTRVVRRSNALLDHSYGRALRYREVVDCGTGAGGALRAWALTLAIGALVAGFSVPPLRQLLDTALPAAGEGPDEKTREEGHFRMVLHARTTTGARYRTVFAAQGDPGYAATAVMLGQTVLALATDGRRLPDRSGVLTPASALGTVLSDRLVRAGFEIDTERTDHIDSGRTDALAGARD